MEWWLWIVAALGLFALEALTPGGFVLFFFGAGALLVGALAAAGVLVSALNQVLAFSVLSIVLLFACRRQLLARLASPAVEIDSLVGEVGLLLDDLAAGGVAKIEVRGSSWSARTTGAALTRGQRCRVARVDGLTLWVAAD